MSGLRIIIDDPEGLRVEAIGAYAGWELGNVQWVDAHENLILGEDVLDPSVTIGSELRAVVKATGPEGDVLELMTPYVYVSGSIQSVRVDLGSEGAVPAFAFSFASVEGMASSVDYKTGPFDDVRVVFFDGRFARYTLDDTDPSVVLSVTEEDLLESFDWQSRYFEYDEQGRVTLQATLYDDYTEAHSQYAYQSAELVREIHHNRLGLREEKQYQDGVISTSFRIDDPSIDAYNFTSDLKAYSNGILRSRSLELDDGVGVFWQYSAGILEHQSRIDHLNVHDYESQVTFFDSMGLVRSSSRLMDDGRQIEFGYENGVRTHVQTTDAQDAYAWSSKINFYSTDGDTELFAKHRNITFDDGRHLYAQYEKSDDAVVIRQSKLSDLEDAFAWTARERSYDKAGTLSHELLTFDDGVLQESQYADGLRTLSSTVDVEDARSFETVERTYNAGELQAASRVMDDGRAIHHQYSDGQLASVVSVDTDDAFLWFDRTDIHTADGLQTRHTQFDDGVIQNEQFSMGQRTVRDRSDSEDAHEWHAILDVFDEGVRVSRNIIWDDDVIA